ncbi:hypothetical protein KSP39_PZI004052 [Platanthera zijinensis]|uniref:Uncharacterized protein n=1 Tax=Platanthera zijinensis TaxID=2320716 RepID=A0AAP0BUX4_9ASPA
MWIVALLGNGAGRSDAGEDRRKETTVMIELGGSPGICTCCTSPIRKISVCCVAHQHFSSPAIPKYQFFSDVAVGLVSLNFIPLLLSAQGLGFMGASSMKRKSAFRRQRRDSVRRQPLTTDRNELMATHHSFVDPLSESVYSTSDPSATLILGSAPSVDKDLFFSLSSLSSMAPYQEDKVNEGYELVREGFTTASKEIQGVIALISENGLEYLVSESTKIWRKEVLEFYSIASVDTEGKKIKEIVHDSQMKLTLKTIRKSLQLPLVKDTDEITPSLTTGALSWCGLSPNIKVGSSITRKGMNSQRKFLSEIVGKVILSVMFDKIQEGVKKPNLGRILSVCLSSVIPDVLKQVAGSKINHMRRMDVRILSRWDRVLTKEDITPQKQTKKDKK